MQQNSAGASLEELCEPAQARAGFQEGGFRVWGLGVRGLGV